jgi:hypothetical protein
MLHINKHDKTALVCKLCNKKFGTFQKLERHHARKIPCDRVLKCEKCNKEFKQISHLNKHKNRKTTCNPIHGDPTIKAENNMCIYCRKVFKNKYNVKSHYNTCKIKAGGMNILFNEIKRLDEKTKRQDMEIRKLKQTPQNSINSITNIENQNNHFGHTFNFNFVDFGDGDDIISSILNKHGMGLLANKFTEDLPRVKQISDRVTNLIGLVFRNPDHKELQGVYVLDLSKTKDNAYYHEDGKWILTDWISLRGQLLQKLYNCLNQSVDNKREDIENIIKYLFVLGNCGNCKTIKKLSDDETISIYSEIGNQMKYNTIEH